jgi:Arc/MetJ family transcription regulator
MRTTLDIPEDLVKEAMKRAGIGTKTEVIVVALNELIRKSKISGLKKYKGKVDLNINLNVIRDRPCR